jgi:peptidoglycan/xylan/chitin deacetylase (PgdA/CDA1 family)
MSNNYNTKNMILSVADNIGLNSIYRLNREKISVLMYHGVAKDEWESPKGNWLQVRESEFRKQMEHLRKYYKVVSIDEAVVTVGSPSDKPRAVVTFDDGYENNYTVAYPILKEFRIPATIFIVPSMIGRSRLFWYDKLMVFLKGYKSEASINRIIQAQKTKHPHTIDNDVDELVRGYRPIHVSSVQETYGILTYEQIHDMQNSGMVTFDSHTNRHEILTKLDWNESVRSIRESLDVLKSNGIKCGKVFCYPNGSYDRSHFGMLRSLGFSCAVSTISGKFDKLSQHFGVPRIGIGRNTTFVEFKGLVSGMWPNSATKVMNLGKSIYRRAAI